MIYVLDIYQSRSLRIVPSPSTFEQISGKTRRVKFCKLWSEWWCKKKQTFKIKGKARKMKLILQCFSTFCFRSKIVVRKIDLAAHKDSFLKHFLENCMHMLDFGCYLNAEEMNRQKRWRQLGEKGHVLTSRLLWF